MAEGDRARRRMSVTALMMWVGGLTMVAAIAVPAFISYVSLPPAATGIPDPDRPAQIPAVISAPATAPLERRAEEPRSTPTCVDDEAREEKEAGDPEGSPEAL